MELFLPRAVINIAARLFDDGLAHNEPVLVGSAVCRDHRHLQ